MAKNQAEMTEEYRRNNVKSQTVRFYPAEIELWNFLCCQENKQGYIKQLIYEDMHVRHSWKADVLHKQGDGDRCWDREWSDISSIDILTSIPSVLKGEDWEACVLERDDGALFCVTEDGTWSRYVDEDNLV